MKTFELPLEEGKTPGSRWELLIRVSPSGRVFGGSEPWFEVKLAENGSSVKESVAVQPFSCFKSVMEGRRTAMMCDSGILAIHRNEDRINVDFHRADGSLVHVEGEVDRYQALIDALASIHH
jgi:hypothetical protein